MSNLYKGPSIDAYYQFQFIWTSGFRGQVFFRYRPIRNKNFLWWPYLLMNRDEMSNLYNEHYIDASYQVSVHLAERNSVQKII
jgi:hypothetical protein